MLKHNAFYNYELEPIRNQNFSIRWGGNERGLRMSFYWINNSIIVLVQNCFPVADQEQYRHMHIKHLSHTLTGRHPLLGWWVSGRWGRQNYFSWYAYIYSTNKLLRIGRHSKTITNFNETHIERAFFNLLDVWTNTLFVY